MDAYKIVKEILPDEKSDIFLSFLKLRNDEYNLLFISGPGSGKSTLKFIIKEYHKRRHISMFPQIDFSEERLQSSKGYKIGTLDEIYSTQDMCDFKKNLEKMLSFRLMFPMVIFVYDHYIVQEISKEMQEIPQLKCHHIKLEQIEHPNFHILRNRENFSFKNI